MSLKYDSINIVLQSLKVLHFTNEAAHTLDDLINFFLLELFWSYCISKGFLYDCMLACKCSDSTCQLFFFPLIHSPVYYGITAYHFFSASCQCVHVILFTTWPCLLVTSIRRVTVITVWCGRAGNLPTARYGTPKQQSVLKKQVIDGDETLVHWYLHESSVLFYQQPSCRIISGRCSGQLRGPPQSY